jgi:hypothetical protein
VNIDNKIYYLIPEEDWKEVEILLRFYLSGGRIQPVGTQKALIQEENHFREETKMIEKSEITVDGQDIKVAQPKISEYRERFKKHQLTKSDVTANPFNRGPLYQFGQDEFSKFKENGKDLFFGNGLEEDYVV